MRYSPSKKCFYPEFLDYQNLPDDLIMLKDDQFASAKIALSSGGTVSINNGAVTVNQPTDAQLRTTAQANQIAVLNRACMSAITGGHVSAALGSQHTYPTQQNDQLNLNANVTASFYPNLPANWTTPQLCMDGNGTWAYVAHTAQQIQQVCADIKAAISALLEKNAAYKAQVEAATTTIDAIQKIVWTG